MKGEDKIRIVLRIPYYTYGATIPDGTLRYIQQRSSLGQYCDLVGVTIGDLLFSFGENTQHDIFINTEPIYSLQQDAVSRYLREFSDSGTFVNSDTSTNVAGGIASIIYDAGVVDTKGIFDGTFSGYDCLIAGGGLNSGDLCDLVLNVEKIYRAEATGGLVK